MTILLSQQIAVFLFLFSCLIVSFLYKRRPKTVEEYALGSKKISTPVLMATMVAAVIGGGTAMIGHSALLYENGLWFFFASFAIPIGYCIMSLVIIPKLSRYYGCLSIVEIIGKMYGNYSRKIVGVIAFLFCLGILGAQIKVFYWVMESVFVNNALLATIIGISTVILYSSIGGASSVIKTGVIQFFVYIIIVPLVANHIIQTSGGITEITATLSKIDRPFFYNGTLGGFIALAIFFLLPDLSPSCLHRLLVGRDCKKNQTATYGLAFVWLLTTIFLGCVAFIAISKFPHIEPQYTLPVVIKNLLPYIWAIVAFKIALVAIIVSTADALVNTSSIILTHDVLPSKITEKQKINLLRGITILSGIVAVTVACFFHSVLDIVLFVSEYYAVIIIVPFIAGLFVKETVQQAFWGSAFMGCFTFTMLRLTHDNFRHEAFLVGLIFSFIAYFSTFFALRKRTISGTSFSIKKLCDRIVGKRGVTLNYLGLGIVFSFMLSVLLNTRGYSQYTTMTPVGYITAFLGFSLLFIDKILLKYTNIMVLFIIWFCLSFSPLYDFLQHDIGAVFKANFVISMVALVVLFSWNVFLTLLLTGGVVASLIFCCFGSSGDNLLSPIMYLSLLLGCISALAYCVLRANELEQKEHIRNEVKSDPAIYTEMLQTIKISLEAEDRYKNILLKNGSNTIHFEDLKHNILTYFKQKLIETKTSLTIIDMHHKILTTKNSASIFYRIVYSLIINVLNCCDEDEISISFSCDRIGNIESLELVHVSNKPNTPPLTQRMMYSTMFSGDVVSWLVLKMLFKRLEMTFIEDGNKLKILFHPSPDPNKEIGNVINIKDLKKQQTTV